MFIDPIVSRYKEHAELVGLCDNSATRATFQQQRLVREYGVSPVPVYDSFDRMLEEQTPDVVIVCTPDYLHHEFIVRSLEFGADVISEKPLTIDAEKCRTIFEAVERTGRTVCTTFNCRWAPGASKVRELIASGTIGRVLHIDFQYYLDTSHGADYFRRWHSLKDCSGGLLVHKATHHFDLINWWTDNIPASVFAFGDLMFYGRKNAIERGDENQTRYPRYTGYPESEGDPFRLALDEDPTLRKMYQEAEKESGYVRDQNVFREGITIEDAMSVLVKYRAGATLSYSLVAFSPVEGFRVTFSGDRGRIDYEERHQTHIITGDKELRMSEEGGDFHRLRVQKLFSAPEDVELPAREGAHGGGDSLIQEQIFSNVPSADFLGRNAGHEQGAASLLVGAAANISIATGQPVNVSDLFPLKPEATALSELI